MAKVFGPALSIDAKGKVGRGVAFQSRPRGTALIKNPRPGQSYLDNPTAAQKTQRDAIAALVSQWHALNTNKREYWNNVDKELKSNINGFNQFMKAKGVATMPLSRLLDYWLDLKRGLVGYWAFDEEGENAAKDYSGEGNNGILKPTYPANCPTQVGSKNQALDKALDFDGVDEYIDCGNKDSLNPNIFSIVFSFYPRAAPAWEGILSKNKYDDVNYLIEEGWMILWSDSNNLYITVMTGAGGKESGWYYLLTPTLNAWNHIVFTVDATIRIKSYLNGELVEDKNWNEIYVPTDYNLLIGARDGNAITNFSNSIFDEVRLYNRILSIDEIKLLNDIYSI